jgi:replicative DNA helicase
MAYALGLKALKRLCMEQNPLAWQKAKLSPALFSTSEMAAYEWVAAHLKLHHTLPQLVTFQENFPELANVETPEPVSFYMRQVENRFYHGRINKANLDSQEALKKDEDDHENALDILRSAIHDIMEQKYRMRILDVGKEAKDLVITAYHHAHSMENVSLFGWPYLDEQSGGALPGDVISFVGRPAAGKTWLTLWTALYNWKSRPEDNYAGRNTLFVSMEMMTLPIAQRIASMYTHSNISQLKIAGYSQPTYKLFTSSLKGFALEKAKFYVIDGNLAASVEDIFILADMLECQTVVIDGAYLLRHKNIKLDRFNRAAENVELIKRFVTDMDKAAFCSWQFNRVASQKQKKNPNEQGDLDDIGYSDAIGQISSIALGLFQEEGIETLKQRKIRIMKGRNGEVGQFSIAWDFLTMNFSQCDPPLDGIVNSEKVELEWV